MNASDALAYLTELIRTDTRHAFYSRTVNVASFAYATATGDKLDSVITSVRTRETKAQEEQRKRLTKALSPVSVEMVKKYFRKLRKTDGVHVTARWQAESSSRQQQLAQVLGDFYAGQDATAYLFDILEDYSFQDPNTFLIIERENVIDPLTGAVTGVRVYPVEVTSDQVRDYRYRHGRLEYLLTEERRTEEARKVKHTVSEFRLYGTGFVLHMVEYKENRPQLTGTSGAPYEQISILSDGSRAPRNFLYFLYLNGTLEVPAIRLGAYLDGQTMQETAVTPMEPVRPLLESLINVGSLHDLTIFLHSIPRRRELVEACDYEDTQGRHCEFGYLDGSEEYICPKCKGTGDKSITSEQDMIRIILPANFTPDQIPDLSKFAHVESADVELLRWQQEKIDWLLKFIVYATMTRDAVTMAEVSRTATELHLNNQDAYDKIQPYAELYSQAFSLIARIATQYLEIADGFMVSHRFPDDYQFETEADLLAKLKAAKEAGAGYDILATIQFQLIRRQTRNVEEAERARAWERWKPWADKSEELIAVAIADRAPDDPDRLLYENFLKVRREVEEETGGMFYRLPYQAQKELIAEKLQEVAGMIRYREAQGVDFGDINAGL